MGVNLHPSQKRSSCEACRKHKLRCKREESDAGRCVRCSRLNLECVLGQQKKVGRPRRPPADGTQPSDTTTSTATFDASKESSSLFSFGHAFGNMDGSSFAAAPNLTPFFYQSPSSGLATSTAANMSALVDFSYEGSLPWDALNIPSFEDASMGSTPSHWPSSSDSHSPPTSTPTSSSSMDECRIDFGNMYSAPSDKPIDPLEAMAFLSKMNLDLHARTLAIARNKDELNFISIVCNDSPLYIDNTTMVQFMICATQDLVQILSRLRHTRRTTERKTCPVGSFGLLSSFSPPEAVSPSSLWLSPRPGSMTTPSTPGHIQTKSQQNESEPLSPPIYFLIASVFVQLISAYETVLYHTAARMICQPIRPLPEMKDIRVGGLLLKDSCSMGIVFTELVTSLLERSERMLGIDSTTMNGDAGLLSVDQKESLWRELGGCRGISVGKARSSSVRIGLENAKRAFLEASMAC